MQRVRWLVVGLGLIASPVGAQVVGTQCWNNNGVLQCNSQAGILYAPPSALQQLGATVQNFSAMLARQRSLAALQQQAAALEAQAQQAEAAHNRDMAAAAQREAAARRLFWSRVELVVVPLADSLRLFGEAARWFGEIIAPSLADLYIVDPMATQEQIREVLIPHLRRLNQRFEIFMERLVPTIRPAVDSLGLTQEELQLLTTALFPVTQDAFMLDPDATAETYQAAVRPLLDRARVYFDSTRAARK